jgi:hypothetical protein
LCRLQVTALHKELQVVQTSIAMFEKMSGSA